MIYKLTKNLILAGNYNKDEMLEKLDLYMLANRITAEQYLELVGLINKDDEKVDEI